MSSAILGKNYKGGEVIIQEGEVGDCMYVIQEGQAEVISVKDSHIERLAVLQEGDFFGEMAIFEAEVRVATVRALGDVRVLTLNKHIFFKRIQEDSTLAFRLVETLSHRVRLLDRELLDVRRQLQE